MNQLGVRARIWLFTLAPVTAIVLGITIAQINGGRLGFVWVTVTAPDSPTCIGAVRHPRDGDCVVGL